jgi:hypothetical protein
VPPAIGRYRVERLGDMRAHFSIADWMAVGDGRTTRREWVAWSNPAAAPGDPAVAPSLPAMLRRRVTPIGHAAFAAALGALSPARNVRFVFASRHGEFSRTLGLLTALAADEPLSPAEFSLSVHNSLAGLLSIAQKNAAGHTTVAAGHDTFVSALLEAAAGLATGADDCVLVVYYDERLPYPYDSFEPAGLPGLAVALLLVPPQPGEEIVVEAGPAAIAAEAPATDAQARDFLRFYLSGAASGETHGTTRLWQWRREAG